MLRQRVITAVVILTVFYLAAARLPVGGFAAFLSLLLLPALLEWTSLVGMTRIPARAGYLLLTAAALLGLYLLLDDRAGGMHAWRLVVLNVLAVGFWLWALVMVRRYPQGREAWSASWKVALMGLCALLPAWVALLYLKQLHGGGVIVFVLIGLVSVADIGAFFAGRAWGRSKLAPELSPNKSWAGFWGGMAASGAVALLLVALLHSLYRPIEPWLWPTLTVAAILVAVFSVVGDLFESMLKRERGIKDSGNILPGHGGALDRMDSLLAAAPVFMLAVLLLSGQVSWL